VDCFFEVFAAAVMSFLFVKLGLVRARTATVNVLFATFVFMLGGVLGTFHHLYFTGTTTPVIALSASFSALEVATRGAFFVAALTVFALIVGIAFAHHPLDWLSMRSS
jgi:nitric oxide reductase large subunit